MNKGKLAVLAVIAVLVAAFFVLDLRQYFSIEYFQSQRAAIEAYFAAHPLRTAASSSPSTSRSPGCRCRARRS